MNTPSVLIINERTVVGTRINMNKYMRDFAIKILEDFAIWYFTNNTRNDSIRDEQIKFAKTMIKRYVEENVR